MKYKSVGFTLIELLIVGVILMFVSLIITQITIATIRANIKVEKMRAVKQAGDFAIDTLNRYIADAVVAPGGCSIAGFVNSTLPLTKTDELGNTTEYEFGCTNNDSVSLLTVEDGTGEVTQILGNSVTLISSSNETNCSSSHPVFTCYSADDGNIPLKIRVDFSLAPKDVQAHIDETMKMDFSTEIVLRNKQE